MVSAGDLGAIFVWDTETWQIIRRLEAHHDVLWALAFDRQGRRLASAGEDRTILIWDTTTWQVIRRLTGHRDRIYTLDFHPEGHLLASGSTDRTARLWDTATGACHHIWIGAGVMRHIVFDSTGGQLITADDDETLEVWDTETYRCLRTIHSQRLYEGLDLTGAVGLSPAQRASLLSLGAVDRLASEGKAGDPE
jgi:WD40 repeat protein